MPDLLVICPTTDVMRDRLAMAFEPVYLADLDDPAGWLAVHGPEILYVLTDGHLGVPPETLATLPNLRLISSYGVGYDAIDTSAATARGIPVTHTPDVLNQEVATTALMLCLACWRNLEAQMAQARSGRWASEGGLPLSRTADGRTIGILGFGRIGKALAAKLAPFSPAIHYHGRGAQDVPYTYHASLTGMARAVDTLISILPGGTATHHMIGAEVLDALGPEGTLINIGRGSVVNEAALIAALKNGRIAAAGLDVFENEPHIPRALRALPNTVLLPHIGSATVETRRAMGDLSIDNLVAHKAGKPLLTPVPESRGVPGT